jgi:hypothetical protein
VQELDIRWLQGWNPDEDHHLLMIEAIPRDATHTLAISDMHFPGTWFFKCISSLERLSGLSIDDLEFRNLPVQCRRTNSKIRLRLCRLLPPPVKYDWRSLRYARQYSQTTPILTWMTASAFDWSMSGCCFCFPSPRGRCRVHVEDINQQLPSGACVRRLGS